MRRFLTILSLLALVIITGKDYLHHDVSHNCHTCTTDNSGSQVQNDEDCFACAIAGSSYEISQSSTPGALLPHVQEILFTPSTEIGPSAWMAYVSGRGPPVGC